MELEHMRTRKLEALARRKELLSKLRRIEKRESIKRKKQEKARQEKIFEKKHPVKFRARIAKKKILKVVRRKVNTRTVRSWGKRRVKLKGRGGFIPKIKTIRLPKQKRTNTKPRDILSAKESFFNK
jgi:hypothetical protein|tara:strand:- start:286 stop:663 length:378 start_codon:yes stop_codon:yes gene_type:complete